MQNKINAYFENMFLPNAVICVHIYKFAKT